MWIWLAALSARAAAPPEVVLTWKGDRGVVQVRPPAGLKIAEEAPATLALTWPGSELRADHTGAELAAGLDVGPVRGLPLTGSVELGLCTLDGATCQMGRWGLSGEVPDLRKGTLALVVGEPPSASPFGPGADTRAAEEAFARAARAGNLVLLDFSAAWCPPCNLLAAEVLHGDPAGLAGFEVAVIDADHPSSWALKDRYEVRGYPTVVVTDAAGVEKARLVGYPGRDAFLAWLRASEGSTEATDLAKGPDGVAPERAAELAWALIQRGEDRAAGPWLTRAAEAPPDQLELRLARARLEHRPEDLAWLLTHAPERIYDFAPSAESVAAADPELARRLVEEGLRRTRGSQLVDLLWMAGEIEPDEVRSRMWYAAAASALTGLLTGDPEHDKGHLTWLAHLQERSGDPEGAIARLEEASARWSSEPTFDLSLVPLLMRLERPEQALVAADRALSRAWGDTRLRAAAAMADVLVALGRRPEAVALAERILAEEPAPAEGVDVRTHGYRKRLAAFLESAG